MGKELKDGITDREAAIIAKQRVFFVATAPNSTHHRVNLSPRAPGSSLAVLSQWSVALCDLSGSGGETAAHLIENCRITFLFVNLEEGPPMIMRLHGTAKIVLPSEASPKLLSRFPKALTEDPGFRAIYVVKVDRVTSSCGYSMPIFEFSGTYRDTLSKFSRNKGHEGMQEYRTYKNSFSIDGLPGLALLRRINSAAGARSLSTSSSSTLLKSPEETVIGPVREAGYVFGESVDPTDEASLKEAQVAAAKANSSQARAESSVVGGSVASESEVDANAAGSGPGAAAGSLMGPIAIRKETGVAFVAGALFCFAVQAAVASARSTCKKALL
jgi:hypothetical protein